MSKTRPNHRSTSQLRAPAFTKLAHNLGRAVLAELLQASQGDMKGERLLVERAAQSLAPAHLSGASPTDDKTRADLLALYEQCLQAYRSSVRPQDAAQPFDDVGAALAYFVATNLGALRGIEPSPAMLQRLEAQLLNMARMTAGSDKASLAERQLYFEHLATIGVLVAAMTRRATSEGAASMAKVHTAARAYLRQVLGIDPEHLDLDESGLSLRTAQNEAHTA
jgi:hypothetical protein